MIFIDGSNFYHCMLQTVHTADFNIEKLAQKLCGKERTLVRVYYYNAPLDRNMDPEKYKKQQQFFEKLKRTPAVEVILVKLHRRVDENGRVSYVVKGDDIHIGVDMVKYAYLDAYDTAILVSGDGDFFPAVRAVKEKGKRVENAYFMCAHSSLLRQECDRSIKMDDFADEILV